MREIRAGFSLAGDDLHDWGETAGTADVCPLSVYRLERLADGTLMVVVGFDGDPDRVAGVLAANEDVIDASVTDERDGLYRARMRPRPMYRQLLEAQRQTPLTLRMPITLDGDGSVTATFDGDEDTFADSLEYLPEEVEIEIEHIRDVTAASRSIFDSLTERQQEVLDAAVTAGYYDDPRGATHADLAAELGVAPTTVSEHLRRIERRVFAGYEPRS